MRLKNIYHHILVLAILLIHGIVSGQVYRSGFYPEDSLAVESFHNRLNIESPLNLQPIDTTLKDFEIYNWPDRKYPFIASLGNSGLAYKNLVFNIQRPVGFNYGINTFDAYLFQQEELKYYLNHKPFSEIGYVTGASKEQLFHARHQQRFFKKLAFGVDFELINSLGTYQHQKSNNRKIAFKSEYFTDNLKYGFIANYSHSKVVVQENGGLANDSIYEHNLEPDRSIIGIKLWNAETNVRKAQIGFQQYYQLSPRKKNDSDSTYLHDKKLQIRFGRLSHTFLYDRNALIYKDENPTSGFYHSIYVDSIATFDSVFFQTLENSFSWSNADYVDRLKPQPLVLLFGIKHQVSQVNDILNSYSYNQLIPYGEIRFTPHPLLNIEGEALTVLSDNEYRGDFKIYGLAQLAILRNQPYNTTFNFAIKTQNLAPPFFYKHFFSNHFKWDNNFSKTFSNQLSAFITQKQIKLGIDFTTLDNYFYIAADTLPAQHKASFQLIKAYLENDFRLGKFDFSGKLFYQKSSNDQVLRVPEFLAYLTFTFNMRFMKGALNTRSGFDLWYNSTYYADAYMPALRSFYLQNEKQIGNFVHADFFINFQVKRTRFFLKTQNILSAFARHYNYYTVPHYPLQDLGVKFGLDWRFND